MVTVSTAAFYGRSNQQLSSLRTRAEGLQSQIGTGERLSRSSDDPAAAALLRNLDRRQRLSEIDAKNADRASTDLVLADQAVVVMADIVTRAKELALQARSTILSDTNFELIETEVLTLRDSLLTLANGRDAAGHALFGGAVPGLAFEEVGGVVSYVGAANAPLTELGEGQAVERSMVGTEILNFTDGAGNPTDMFIVLSNFAAAMATGGAAAGAGAEAALDLLDSGLEKVTSAQTIIGTRQAWIETVGDKRTASRELVSGEQAKLGGADLASTISRLQELMTVLEASQASFVRLSNLTLFDLLN